jgi:osmotically inducible protein OsmC
MADIQRTASAVWNGNLIAGNGTVSTGSGAIVDEAYTFRTRFENAPGSNPEELISAAQAACYSMAFAHTLAEKGYNPESITTKTTCTMTPLKEGGFKISKLHLDVTGKVPGIDDATFKAVAREAELGCPVANAFRGCIELEFVASLQ